MYLIICAKEREKSLSEICYLLVNRMGEREWEESGNENKVPRNQE